ncbi:MAG: ribonuclease P protein component [Nitrospira sp.]|nr:ribonuclease P protein component [Nitrospira sp.]
MKKSRDYARVKLRGRRLQNSLFNVMFCENQISSSRVGIVVGRRFGKAVLRNRAKRIFRELVRAIHDELVKGYDIIIFPKPSVLDQQFQIVQKNWKIALHKIGVLRPSPHPSCPESFSG